MDTRNEMFHRARRAGSRRRAILCVVVMASALVLTSCIQAPRATVEASTLVEERIADLQVSHEAMLSAYFDLMRQHIEDFLSHRWIPTFLEEFIDAPSLRAIADPDVLSEGDKERLAVELATAFAGVAPDFDRVVLAVNRTLGDAERGKIILLIARVANETIDRQRSELLAPIGVLEKEALAELRSSYVDVLKLQGSITGYLRSISDVTAARDAVLDELGLLEARDEVLAKVISLNDGIETAIKTGQEAEDILGSIMVLLGLAPREADEMGSTELERLVTEAGEQVEREAAESRP